VCWHLLKSKKRDLRKPIPGNRLQTIVRLLRPSIAEEVVAFLQHRDYDQWVRIKFLMGQEATLANGFGGKVGFIVTTQHSNSHLLAHWLRCESLAFVPAR
jgi:hypothetical protein